VNLANGIKTITGYYALRNFIKLHYYKIKGRKSISMMPFVYDEIATLEEIIHRKCSVARYGDGETAICLGEGIPFQEYDNELSRRLREILMDNSIENLLICISPHVNSSYALTYKFYGYIYKFFARRGLLYVKLLKQDKKYGSALISRPEVFLFENVEWDHYRLLLRKLWENRDVLIVTGKGSRFVLIPELFDNVKSSEFIYSLSKNAFCQYDSLLAKIKSYSKDKLILLALGPTATVLVYDLAKEGYRSIDIGHLPSCYEVVKSGSRPAKLGY
jgi:glycosyltransferase family protein